MKKEGFILFVFLALNAGFITADLQEKQKESVTVTAVEVPIRVLDNRGPIQGLKREDFEVYENGVKPIRRAFG